MHLQEQKSSFLQIERVIKLPSLRKLLPHQSPFPQTGQQFINSTGLSNQLKKNVVQLRDCLINQFRTYQDVEKFNFYFPESKFPSVPIGEKNNISYEQKMIVQDQNTFKDKLSQQQIQQIRLTGQFKVKSTKQWVKLPYVWKMNDSMFKGIRNVQADWKQRLCDAFQFIYNAWQMFTSDLPKQLKRVGKWPLRLFCLFFGNKAMFLCYAVDYHRQLAKDFWNQVMDKYYSQSKQWGSQLWIYLDSGFIAQNFTPVQFFGDNKEYENLLEQKSKRLEDYRLKVQDKNKRIQEINALTNEFQNSWVKTRKKVFSQISQSITNKLGNAQGQVHLKAHFQLQEIHQCKIIQKVNEQKFIYYTDFLSKSLPKKGIPNEFIQALLTILALMHIFAKKKRIFDGRIKEQSSRIQDQIREKDPIKSGNLSWYSDKVARMHEPMHIRMEEQFYRQFMDEDLRRKLSSRQVQVYELWLQYVKSYDAKMESKKQIKQQFYSPSRKFQQSYALLPPYNVFKHQYNPQMGQLACYQIIKSHSMSVTTANACWKFYLYSMRLKCWTVNCLVYLFYFAWKGTFGLRCLCGVDQFAYDQEINRETGEIIQYQRKPVLGHFFTAMEGIQKSRTQFQSLPDTGIFGKNCSRLCNLIECYVFRFLIVAVLITLILYPVAIILVSLLAFLLIITVWAWMPLVLVLTYLFNILIYQFESSRQPYQCYVRAFPLFSLFISLVFSIVKIFFYIVVLVIASPIYCTIVLIYSCICRCLRSATDCVMLCLISHLGRTPSRDTAIAKKISGPGMSKEYFMSINQEDLYILIQAQLQQLYMQRLSRITRQKINQPVNNINNSMKLIMETLTPKSVKKKYQNNSNDCDYLYHEQLTDGQNYSDILGKCQVQKSVDALRAKFDQEYQQFMPRYPKKPHNIRFTQDQINSYFQNTQSIVKSYISKNYLGKWVFQHFDIQENDLEQLTRKLWIRVFQCGQQIFQPLQQIDQRFKLEDQYINDYPQHGTTGIKHSEMKSKVHKVMEALQGQVDLKPRRAKLGNFKHSLINKEIDIFKTHQMFDSINLNSQRNVFFSKNTTNFLLYPHLSIKELIKLEQIQYVKRKQQNQRDEEQWA